LIDLYDDVLKGKAPEALKRLNSMHQAGADAAIVLQDMLELTHWLTRAKITPEPLSDPATPEAERAWGAKVTPDLSVPVLARLWQMLLKGLGEVQAAPQPLPAAEMVLIRLMHAAHLPDPADLVRRLSEGNGASAPGPAPRTGGDTGRSAPASAPRLQTQQQTVPQAATAPRTAPQASLPQPQSFGDVVALFHARREAILAAHLQSDVHLVQFEVGRIDFRPSERAPTNLPNRVAACLAEWTGKRWLVSVSAHAGEKTLKEQAAELAQAQREEAARHPLIQAVLAAFPGATIDEVRNLAGEPAAEEAASPQADATIADEPAEDEIA
jgi:DNA polymerase-3 subunit gamma/tau